MLIGDNFVFVENPKTASTSIQNALHPYGETVHGKHSTLLHHDKTTNRRWRMYAVRNPWDRLVSGYHYHTKAKDMAGFGDWLLGDPWIIGDGIDFKRTSQRLWFHMTNIVIRYEYLQGDFDNACEKIGLPKTELPHMNGVKVRGDYRNYFSDELSSVVRDRFYWEIKTYGYEFA